MAINGVTVFDSNLSGSFCPIKYPLNSVSVFISYPGIETVHLEDFPHFVTCSSNNCLAQSQLLLCPMRKAAVVESSLFTNGFSDLKYSS